MSDLTAKIVITAKDLTQKAINGVKSGLDGLGTSTDKAAKDTESLSNEQDKQRKSTDELSSSTNKYGGILSSTTAKVVAAGAAFAAYFGVKFFAGAVEDAQALETQMGTLESIIQSTGKAAGLSAQDILEMSKRLDEQTLGSAEGFRNASASLLTFKSVGKDSFETVLSLAQDLASAGFGSLETNARQLGKALEDPVRGLTTLRESGVSFTESQTALIKSLVETGQKAKAQEIILKALADQVGGAGSGAGGGLAGAVDLVAKRFTDFKEQLGSGMLKPLQEVNLILADFIKRLTDTGVIKAFGDAIASGFGLVIDSAIGIYDAVDSVYKQLKDTGAVDSFKDAYSNAFSTLLDLAGQLYESFNRVYETITNSSGATQSVEGLVRVLTTLYQGVTLFVSAFTTGLTTIEAAFHGLTGVAELFWSTFQSGLASFKANMASITFGDVSARWQAEADASKASSEEWAAAAEDSFGRAEEALLKTAENAQKTTDAAINLGKEYEIAGEKAATSAETLVSAEREKAAAIVETGQAATEAGEQIATANTAAAESTQQVLDATKALNIDMDILTGAVTEAGTAGAQAFSALAESAGLTSEQLAKAAESAIALAKTEADVDLLRQRFVETGVEIDKHPALITAIIKKIQEVGGSLEGIPQKWLEIASATDKATASSNNYADSISAAAQQQEHFNGVLADEASQRAILAKATRDQAAAQKELKASRSYTSSHGFSEAGSAAYGSLSPSGIKDLEILISDQNAANARGNSGRVQLDIEKVVIGLAAAQASAEKAATEQTTVLKTMSNTLERRGNVTVNLDGREIATSLARAGLTSR